MQLSPSPFTDPPSPPLPHPDLSIFKVYGKPMECTKRCGHAFQTPGSCFVANYNSQKRFKVPLALTLGNPNDKQAPSFVLALTSKDGLCAVCLFYTTQITYWMRSGMSLDRSSGQPGLFKESWSSHHLGHWPINIRPFPIPLIGRLRLLRRVLGNIASCWLNTLQSR